MNKWTAADIKRLHDIVNSNGGPGIQAFRKASKELNRSVSSCEAKYPRGESVKAPDGLSAPWNPHDNARLFAMRSVEKKSYSDIAAELGRTPIACERQYQRNQWDNMPSDPKFLTKIIQTAAEEITIIEEQECLQGEAADNERVVAWLISTVKWDYEKLQEMTDEIFQEKLKRVFSVSGEKIQPDTIHLTFDEYKQHALVELENMGFAYPLSRQLGKGLHIVVGESHGKHMSTDMFALLKVMDNELKPQSIIHQGHISDDEDKISYNWHQMFGKKLIVLGVKSELPLLKDQDYQYDVLRHHVRLGNRVVVINQYDVGDFAKKSVGRIDMRTLNAEVAIVGLHRHEVYTHCSHPERKIIASAGGMCEKHIIMTEKMYIGKKGDKITRLRKIMPQGFKKYNKQEQDAERWEQGLLIVEVDDKGDATITPCRIRKTCLGYTTAFFDKIFTSQGIRNPDKKIFFNGDAHCAYHDPAVLDVQEQFCLDYRPDVHVNLGDMADNRSLNHHMGGLEGAAFFYNSKGEPTYSRLIQEIAAIRWLTQRMRKWAPESYFVTGNHERFLLDFIRVHPQLHGIIEVEDLIDSKGLDIKVTPLKQILKLYGLKFIHGDQKFYGGIGGSKIDKATNCCGENTIMGHLHYTCVRAGGYMVGLSGKLEQEYNEPQTSQWIHGLGYANVFDGQCFVTVVSIVNGKFMTAGKTYTPRDLSSWEVPPYSVSLAVKFEPPTRRLASGWNADEEVQSTKNVSSKDLSRGGAPRLSTKASGKPTRASKGRQPPLCHAKPAMTRPSLQMLKDKHLLSLKKKA